MMMSNEEKCFGDVLDTNYWPETSEVDKDFLEDWIRYLKDCLNWNISDEDSLFDKERGPEIVRHLLTQYKFLSFHDNNFDNLLGIYTIAKFCFHYWIRDSEIVSEVLRQVYVSAGHFSGMLAHTMYLHGSRLIWSYIYREEELKQYMSMLYFVTHAHSAKLEFSGERFVDLLLIDRDNIRPVFWAALYIKPQLLLVLLRHGAIVDQRLTDEVDFNSVLQELINNLWISLGEKVDASSWDTMDISRRYTNDNSLCLRYLLRVCRQIPKGTMEFYLMSSDSSGYQIQNNSHDFILSLSEQELVPNLRSRYLEPSGLRHLCRLVIRDALNKNWNLPFGIFSLPLPKVLQRYINLAED